MANSTWSQKLRVLACTKVIKPFSVQVCTLDNVSIPRTTVNNTKSRVLCLTSTFVVDMKQMNALTGFHWYQLSAPIFLLHANRQGRIWYCRCCKERVESLKTSLRKHQVQVGFSLHYQLNVQTRAPLCFPSCYTTGGPMCLRFYWEPQDWYMSSSLTSPDITQVCMTLHPSLSEIYTAKRPMVQQRQQQK